MKKGFIFVMCLSVMFLASCEFGQNSSSEGNSPNGSSAAQNSPESQDIKAKAEWLVEPSFDFDGIDAFFAAFETQQSVFAVRDGKTGLVDYNGNVLIPYMDSLTLCGCNDSAPIAASDENLYSYTGANFGMHYGHGGGYRFLYDTTSKKLLGFEFGSPDEAMAFGYSTVMPAIEILSYNEFGEADFNELDYFVFVNKDGASGAEKYEAVMEQSKSLIPVKLNGKWGYIDQTGKKTIDFTYDKAFNFSGGAAAVCKDGKWGYVAEDGSILIDFEYEEARPSFENKAWVKQGGKWGVLKIK